MVALYPKKAERAVPLFGGLPVPLVYAQDPRADVPAELEKHLVQAIEGSDDRIVSGWLQYGLPGPDLNEE